MLAGVKKLTCWLAAGMFLDALRLSGFETACTHTALQT